MITYDKNRYINSNSNFALSEFYNLVFNCLSANNVLNKDLIILCIGTDRSTGDSLGPIVGHKLLPMIKTHDNIHLFGTLENPVHAKNLEKHIKAINNSYDNPFIIAIDSSLGKQTHVGYLSIENSSLKPGAGVNKSLPAVGDVSITGIVNISGMLEYMVLQSTRLSLVITMADIIYKSLYLSIYRLYRKDYSLRK